MRLSDAEFIETFKKTNRFFSLEAAKRVNEFVATIAPALGGVKSRISLVSPKEVSQNPELSMTTSDLFWRCVRPNKNDVGSPHADFQFWEIARGTDQEAFPSLRYDQRWKIWIPLMGCTSKNSLRVLPGSHRDNIPFKYLSTVNGVKPIIDLEFLDKHSDKFICPIPELHSTCILFHDRLVHMGPANVHDELRVSVEFTVLLQKKRERQQGDLKGAPKGVSVHRFNESGPLPSKPEKS